MFKWIEHEHKHQLEWNMSQTLTKWCSLSIYLLDGMWVGTWMQGCSIFPMQLLLGNIHLCISTVRWHFCVEYRCAMQHLTLNTQEETEHFVIFSGARAPFQFRILGSHPSCGNRMLRSFLAHRHVDQPLRGPVRFVLVRCLRAWWRATETTWRHWRKRKRCCP